MPFNTNIILKPHSCQDPNTILSTFKSEICRAHRLCTAPSQTQKVIDFDLSVFQDKSHSCNHLEAFRRKYVPPPLGGASSIATSSSNSSQTARSVETQIAEHKKATDKGKWSHSGITQHCHPGLPIQCEMYPIKKDVIKSNR
jgi:hypothetical protein